MTCKTKLLIGANRLSDWPERLYRLVDSNQQTPFEWGDFDCSQFCIQAEQAMYGDTRWTDLIGGYKTKRGAGGRIKRAGGESLWDLIDQRMERLDSVKLAQRGDWIGHYTDDGESLGICLGHYFVSVCLDGGLVSIPMNQSVCAWRG